jgi:hypothetical protein
MPLFEAVINSIHAIEELSQNSDEGKITIEIIRSSQNVFRFKEQHTIKNDIIGFKIIDNGIGFNDTNMSSFEMLDSDLKAEKGCKGIGRLLWLKVFKKVEIQSIYIDKEEKKSRTFTFDSENGIVQYCLEEEKKEMLQTTVSLLNFDERYRQDSPKTLELIGKSLLEHCLWYFVKKENVPQIYIKDDVEITNLHRLFEEYKYSSTVSEKLLIKGSEFEITHLKFRLDSKKNHSIAYCAANRVVQELSLESKAPGQFKIPGLSHKISDEDGEFIYCCYLSSSYLNEKVRMERTDFDLFEDNECLFSKTEISKKNIQDAVFPKIREFLSSSLDANIREGRERLHKYVDNHAPKYRPVLKYIPDDDLIFDSTISDKDLDIQLHKWLYEVEKKLIQEGHDIMIPHEHEQQKEYKGRIQKYLNLASDIKKSDLANYVSHRKVIIDLLQMATQQFNDGKYGSESLIHELIMPMNSESNEILLDDCNLWLLDERLAFHNYLASDKRLKKIPITGAEEIKRPDLCALNVWDNPILVAESSYPDLASINIVEIKRPIRNDAKLGEETDPIKQVLEYVELIRKGKIKTYLGRPIPQTETVPAFCYIICDITENMINLCRTYDLKVTSDGLAYFGYHNNYKTFIEVISFDRLVFAAKQRNKAFFDKLGLPTN